MRDMITFAPLMLRRILPYHILGGLIAAAILLSWGKIHKHSFYAHYFRVTQEVEARNSHLLPITAADVFFGEIAEPITPVFASAGLPAHTRYALCAAFAEQAQTGAPGCPDPVALRHCTQHPANGPPASC